MYILLFYAITETLYKLHLSSDYYILIIDMIFQVKENSAFGQIRLAELYKRMKPVSSLECISTI